MERRHIVNHRIARVVSTGGVAALILAALLFVPVSYEVEVGSVVTASWKSTATDPNRIAERLEGLDGLFSQNVRLNGEHVSAQLLFRGMGADEAERRVRELLAGKLDPASGPAELSSRRIMKKVGGNALAAITGGTIRVNAAGLSDREIEEAIVAEFATHGVRHSEAQVVTDTDGERRIDIMIETDGDGEAEMSYEVEITD